VSKWQPGLGEGSGDGNGENKVVVGVMATVRTYGIVYHAGYPFSPLFIHTFHFFFLRLFFSFNL